MSTRRAPGTFLVLDRAALDVLQRLSRPAIVVYLRLANRADSTGKSWPSIASLVADTGVPRRSIERSLTELSRSGLITRISGKGCRETNIYLVNRAVENGNSAVDSEPPEPPPNTATHGGIKTPNTATHGGTIPPPMADEYRHPWRANTATHGGGNDTHLTKPTERDTLNDAADASASKNVAAVKRLDDLKFLVKEWNKLAIKEPVKVDPIRKSVIEGWKRVLADEEAREIFADQQAIRKLIEAIPKNTLAVGSDWFSIGSLFEKDTHRIQWKASKLLKGEYKQSTPGKPPPPKETCRTMEEIIAEDARREQEAQT